MGWDLTNALNLCKNGLKLAIHCMPVGRSSLPQRHFIQLDYYMWEML